MNKKIMKNGGERGNALFLILIAVALFAALSYAITQSGRGGGNISNQTALITAGEVSETPADIRSAVSRMVLSGQGGSGLVFLHSADLTDASANVFTQPLGGGAVNVTPPTSACSTASDCGDWAYVAAIAGPSPTKGNFVQGLGTIGVGGSDAFAVLGAGCGAGIGNGVAGSEGDVGEVTATTNCGAAHMTGGAAGSAAGLTLPVCSAINKGLGFATAAVTAPPVMQVTVIWGQVTAGYVAAGTGGATVSDSSGYTTGQDFACVNDNSRYEYYASLLDQ